LYISGDLDLSEHDAMEPNKPALAALAIAGILIAISITSVLVIPGLQPRFIPISSVGGGPTPPTGPEVGGVAVTIIAPAGSGINEINFSPHNFVLVIGVNNTFVLKNQDTADHTVTSNPGDPASFDTGDISGLSSSNPITLTTPGTYAFHCQFHPAYMHGTITVVAGNPVPAS
jgi:plastocyanin